MIQQILLVISIFSIVLGHGNLSSDANGSDSPSTPSGMTVPEDNPAFQALLTRFKTPLPDTIQRSSLVLTPAFSVVEVEVFRNLINEWLGREGTNPEKVMLKADLGNPNSKYTQMALAYRFFHPFKSYESFEGGLAYIELFLGTEYTLNWYPAYKINVGNMHWLGIKYIAKTKESNETDISIVGYCMLLCNDQGVVLRAIEIDCGINNLGQDGLNEQRLVRVGGLRWRLEYLDINFAGAYSRIGSSIRIFDQDDNYLQDVSYQELSTDFCSHRHVNMDPDADLPFSNLEECGFRGYYYDEQGRQLYLLATDGSNVYVGWAENYTPEFEQIENSSYLIFPLLVPLKIVFRDFKKREIWINKRYSNRLIKLFVFDGGKTLEVVDGNTVRILKRIEE